MLVLFLLLLKNLLCVDGGTKTATDILLVTVATEQTDGLKRLQKSAEG